MYTYMCIYIYILYKYTRICTTLTFVNHASCEPHSYVLMELLVALKSGFPHQVHGTHEAVRRWRCMSHHVTM